LNEAPTFLMHNELPDIEITSKRLDYDEKQQPYLHIETAITEDQREHLLSDSEVIFTVRLAITSKLYFPYPRLGDNDKVEDYYLGFRTKSIAGGKNGVFTTFEDGFVEIQVPQFLPLQKLLKGKVW